MEEKKFDTRWSEKARNMRGSVVVDPLEVAIIVKSQL